MDWDTRYAKIIKWWKSAYTVHLYRADPWNRRMASMVAQWNKRSATGGTKLTVPEIRRMREAQQDRCALTGRRLTPDNSVVDHARPLTRGGAHCVSNAQLLTKAANRAKGTMTTEEFVALCVDVVKTRAPYALAQ